MTIVDKMSNVHYKKIVEKIIFLDKITTVDIIQFDVF